LNRYIIVGFFFVYNFLYGSDGSKGVLEDISCSGELRFGAVDVEDESNHHNTTLSLGGRASFFAKVAENIGATATFFTTNALFGKSQEAMFLDSNKKSYSILGEAYFELNYQDNIIRVGRQIVDTPYADSDDIGMVPNSFEGYTLINRGVENTTLVLAWLDKWAGVDSPTPEKFKELIEGKHLLTTGFIYSKDEITAEYWYYDLDDVMFHYLEAEYSLDDFEFGLQYSDQDRDNSVYGAKVGVDFDNFSVGVAYNRVDGVVSNGFGGGPFFTSSEDHTIADIKDQEAIAYSLEYAFDRFSFGVAHTDFNKGEDETDYSLSFEVNSNHTLDLIYANMYGDGSIFKFLANYRF